MEGDPQSARTVSGVGIVEVRRDAAEGYVETARWRGTTRGLQPMLFSPARKEMTMSFFHRCGSRLSTVCGFALVALIGGWCGGLFADTEYNWAYCSSAGLATCKSCLMGTSVDTNCGNKMQPASQYRCRLYQDSDTQGFWFTSCVLDSNSYSDVCNAEGEAANTCTNMPYWSCDCVSSYLQTWDCTNMGCYCSGDSPGNANLTPAATCTD